jgi:epoxyqueuosine reductase
MPPPVLPEWSGEQLVYLTPTQSVNRFGYTMVHDRTADELRFLQSALDRVPLQDGEPAPERVPFPDPATAAAAVKQWAREAGADMVGITAVDRRWVYRGEDLPHRAAVVIAVAMDYEAFRDAPRAETNAEVLRVYDEVGRIAVLVARRIRERGYPARAHTLRREQVAMLPLAHAAGLGELGKHGSLLNRELGCMFRLSVVTTDLPLAEDAPRDEGLDAFCASCQMCVAYCPGDAISPDKQEVRGVVKWVVDTAKCAPYWGSYYACAICLQVCPVNARAFGGRVRHAFIQTIKRIDRQEMRARLRAGLQRPWTHVSPPAPTSGSHTERRGGDPARHQGG